MSSFLDKEGLAYFYSKLVKTVNGNSPDGKGNIQLSIGGSGSLNEVSVTETEVSLDPDCVYIFPETITEYTITLNEGTAGIHHEYYMIFEISDTAPTITWPEGIRFQKDFSANSNSTIAVRIVKGVVLWEYLWQESPELDLINANLSDYECTDVTGGWSFSHWSTSSNIVASGISLHVGANGGVRSNNTSGNYGGYAITTKQQLDWNALMAAGYTKLNWSGIRKPWGSSFADIGQFGICVNTASTVNSNLATALGTYSQLYFVNDANDTSSWQTISGSASINEFVNTTGLTALRISVRLGAGPASNGESYSGSEIFRLWLSKE